MAEHPGCHLAEKHIYLDDVYSGAKLNRPGLDRLREHVTKAKFEMILITAPDRLAEAYPKSCTSVTCVYCVPRDDDHQYFDSLLLLFPVR